jgi:uncharacterized protein
MTDALSQSVRSDSAESPARDVIVFEKRSLINAPAEAVFEWHERPGAFQRLTPPWEQIRLISQSGGIRDGARVEIELRIGPIRKRWLAEHCNYAAGRQFQDVQIGGPFAHFEHTHRISPETPESCELEDHIEYVLPLGRLGEWLGGRFVRQTLERTFRYRHNITINDIRAHAGWEGKQAMKVLVTGATGLVGSALVPFLTTGGHEVFRLTRSAPTEANDIVWNPDRNELPKARLEGLDAVIHLAGENIAKTRWNSTVKDRIRRSRVNGTRLLCETLAGLKQPPKTLIAASAIGFYGNRGAEMLNESASAGTGFLPELCRDWEAACEPARAAGIRVANLRIGVVLSPKGGGLAAMLTPFKLGVGGVVGSGRQYWSWVAIDDVVGAIHHCLMNDKLSGPVNLTAPSPVSNVEFTKTLGRVLGRPTIFPMPSVVARIALGEMANDLLLGSARVMPNRLSESNYEFRCPTLEGALRHVLGL